MSEAGNQWRDSVDRYCDGTLSAEQTAELERQLRDDPAAMDFFVLYAAVHARIAWNIRSRADVDKQADPADTSAARPSEAAGVSAPLPASAIIHSPFYSLIGGAVLTYAVAAVLVGLGVLAAWTWNVPRDSTGGPVAAHFEQPAPVAVAAKPQIVATITSVNNCQWVSPEPEKEVATGKIVLASGLLEITYSSGAKVILEGPAHYQVAAPSGGYLFRGKLTLCVPQRPANGGGNQTSDPAETPAVGRPAFQLLSPTSVVMNRGGECGLAVDESGASRVHVFRGAVQLRLPGRTEEGRLSKDYWAWIRFDEHKHRIVVWGKGESAETFARQMPDEPPMASDGKQRDFKGRQWFPAVQF